MIQSWLRRFLAVFLNPILSQQKKSDSQRLCGMTSRTFRYNKYIVYKGSERMQIAICDDEMSIRQLLKRKVEKLSQDISIELFCSGKELLFSACSPDILLLDIQMPEENGIEIAKEFRSKNKKTILIFVTALEEYVFDAFDVGAFHYLVKPIDDKKFDNVLNKAITQISKREVRNSKYKEESHIMVKSKGITRKIFLRDIIYAEVFNRSIILHLKNEKIEYYGKMKELEAISGNAFFRTHRSYLVNLKYVTGYEARKVYMRDKEALLSKSNYSEFVKAFLYYHRRNEG